eukprot:s4006_g12.t1
MGELVTELQRWSRRVLECVCRFRYDSQLVLAEQLGVAHQPLPLSERQKRECGRQYEACAVQPSEPDGHELRAMEEGDAVAGRRMTLTGCYASLRPSYQRRAQRALGDAVEWKQSFVADSRRLVIQNHFHKCTKSCFKKILARPWNVLRVKAVKGKRGCRFGCFHIELTREDDGKTKVCCRKGWPRVPRASFSRLQHVTTNLEQLEEFKNENPHVFQAQRDHPFEGMSNPVAQVVMRCNVDVKKALEQLLVDMSRDMQDVGFYTGEYAAKKFELSRSMLPELYAGETLSDGVKRLEEEEEKRQKEAAAAAEAVLEEGDGGACMKQAVVSFNQKDDYLHRGSCVLLRCMSFVMYARFVRRVARSHAGREVRAADDNVVACVAMRWDAARERVLAGLSSPVIREVITVRKFLSSEGMCEDGFSLAFLKWLLDNWGDVEDDMEQQDEVERLERAQWLLKDVEIGEALFRRAEWERVLASSRTSVLQDSLQHLRVFVEALGGVPDPLVGMGVASSGLTGAERTWTAAEAEAAMSLQKRYLELCAGGGYGADTLRTCIC